MATHSSILAWEVPWSEEPGKLWSTELQRVRHDWSDWAHTHTHTHTHTHILSTQQLFLIIPEVEPHFLFWVQCIQIHKMTHSLPNPIMILLFCAMFSLGSELWSISCNWNICAPEKKILAKNHMQPSWHHKWTHFYTLRMAELKDGKSLKPQSL